MLTIYVNYILYIYIYIVRQKLRVRFHLSSHISRLSQSLKSEVSSEVSSQIPLLFSFQLCNKIFKTILTRVHFIKAWPKLRNCQYSVLVFAISFHFIIRIFKIKHVFIPLVGEDVPDKCSSTSS